MGTRDYRRLLGSRYVFDKVLHGRETVHDITQIYGVKADSINHILSSLFVLIKEEFNCDFGVTLDELLRIFAVPPQEDVLNSASDIFQFGFREFFAFCFWVGTEKEWRSGKTAIG